MILGFASPALAIAERPLVAGVTPAGPVGGDKCLDDGDDEYPDVMGADPDRHDKNCVGPTGATGPTGPVGPCVDISTSWDEEEVKYKAVLAPNGTAWAGVYDFDADNLPAPGIQPAFTWYNLSTPSTTYPSNPCGITIAETANTVIVEVVTTTGQVYETTCDVDRGEPDLLDCPTPRVWTPAIPQPPGTTLRNSGMDKGLSKSNARP